MNIRDVRQNPIYKTRSLYENVYHLQWDNRHYEDLYTKDLLSRVREIETHVRQDVLNEDTEVKRIVDREIKTLSESLNVQNISEAFYEQYYSDLSRDANDPEYQALLEGKVWTGFKKVLGKALTPLKWMGLGLVGLSAYFIFKASQANDARQVVSEMNRITTGSIFGWGSYPANARDGKDTSKKVEDKNLYIAAVNIAADPKLKDRQLKQIDGSYVSVLRSDIDAMKLSIDRVHETLFGNAQKDRIPEILKIGSMKEGKSWLNLFNRRERKLAAEVEATDPGILSELYTPDRSSGTALACYYKSKFLSDSTPSANQSVPVPAEILGLILKYLKDHGLTENTETKVFYKYLRAINDPVIFKDENFI